MGAAISYENKVGPNLSSIIEGLFFVIDDCLMSFSWPSRWGCFVWSFRRLQFDFKVNVMV